MQIEPTSPGKRVFCTDTLAQGADMLAHAGYQVYIPDFFHGEPFSSADFPPDTPEKGAKLGTFFQGVAAPPKTVGAIPRVIKDIEAKAGGKIEKWGVVGMCWGGKVIIYMCNETMTNANLSLHAGRILFLRLG